MKEENSPLKLPIYRPGRIYGETQTRQKCYRFQSDGIRHRGWALPRPMPTTPTSQQLLRQTKRSPCLQAS